MDPQSSTLDEENATADAPGTSARSSDAAGAGLMCDEGRRAVDEQNRRLRDIDAKASRLLRANLVLVGLLLSGLSVVATSESMDVSPYLNTFSLAGLLLLLSSIVASGVTYTATELRIGVSHGTIRTVVSDGMGRDVVERGLAKAYARWIELNGRANVENAFYVSVTILLVLEAVILLATGLTVGAIGGRLPDGVRPGLWIPVLVILGGIVRLTGVRGDFDAWRDLRARKDSSADRSINRDDT